MENHDEPDVQQTEVGRLQLDSDVFVGVDHVYLTGEEHGGLVGLWISEGEADAEAELTAAGTQALVGLLRKAARLTLGQAEVQCDSPDRIVRAAAADGYAMTPSELQAFLADLGGDVPDADVSIRARVSHLGDIASITAQIPPAPGTGTPELLGDAFRDLAAMLEAERSGDLVADFMMFSGIRGTAHWTMLRLLIPECLQLAEVVYGDNVPAWIDRFRQASFRADAGGDGED